MGECPTCGMRDDDWFLCRREDCVTKSSPNKDETIAALSAELETVKGERDALAEAIGKDRVRLIVEKTAAEAQLAKREAGEAGKRRHIGTIAHINHGKTALTAAVLSALTHPAPTHEDGSGEVEPGMVPPVAGWVVLKKSGDGLFMSAADYDQISAAAEADIHDCGYFAIPLPHTSGEVTEAARDVLFGPYGWLNGCRALNEESWELESDPLENNDEYFAIPLYARTDPFKEIGRTGPASRPDAIAEAARKALVTMQRYQRAGLGDDVFFDDLCQSIRALEAALRGEAS